MKPAWDIDLLPIFVAVVEHKGVTAAAKYLQMPKSSVSKSLTRLEDSLGLRLLERNSRNIRVTSEGEVLYQQSLRILEEVHEASSLMAGFAAHPCGKLVVALPIAFTREFIAPKIAEFCHLYPDIDLEVLVDSRPVDIIHEQIDLAVVIGALEHSDLIVRTLYESRLTCVTTPEYAAMHQLQSPEANLEDHINICETRYALSKFPIRKEGKKKNIDLKARTVKMNDPISVREAVLNGFGVAVLPDQYCHKLLQAGKLINVFKDVEFDISAAVLSVVYPSRRLVSNKTQAFLAFLMSICAAIE